MTQFYESECGTMGFPKQYLKKCERCGDSHNCCPPYDPNYYVPYDLRTEGG
jgi:hypothetical protein